MSKISTIRIQNFKAIDDLEMDFHGATAIITGRNNSGKTSFLKGIVDRIRFIRPDVMVKKGAKEGMGELVLDTGEKFKWEFDIDKKDKLTYITDQGRKSVTKEFGEQFFPAVFDIDKFLQSSPKQQVKQLQAIVGIDFEEIEKRYTEAYNIRTERNREAEIYHVKLEKMMKVDRVESVDLTKLKEKKEAEREKLNQLYLDNKSSNQQKKQLWEQEKEKILKECNIHNEQQTQNELFFDTATQAAKTLTDLGFVDSGIVASFLKDLFDKIKPKKIPATQYPKEPTYIEERPDSTELEKIDEQLLKAAETNAQAQKYQEYIAYKEETEAAKDAAQQANDIVINIEMERQRMINSAKFPEGITIGAEGILVNGLPLDKNQISSSLLYITALKIASLNIGEVRSLYFDATLLDRNSLAEVSAWADENNYQLLLERVAYDASDITYELIESNG